MFKNYLTTALRHLVRRKGYSFICNLFLAALSIILSVKAHAQGDMTAEKWREDLRYLQEVVTTERSNLFHKVTSAEFNQAVNELNAKIPQMQRHEVIVGLARLVAMFRIGHTVLPLQVWQGDPNPGTGFHRFPVLVHFFSDGVYVRSAREAYREAVGGRVVSLGKLTIDQALEAVRPVVQYENEQGFKSEVPYYLSCPEVLHAAGVIDDLERAPLVIAKNGKEQTIWLQAEESGIFPGHYGTVNPGEGWVDARQFAEAPTPLWLKNLQRNYFYGDVVRKDLPNSGLRVFLSHLWWQNLDPRDTREWTAPQIAVDMTFDDYRNNRDPVMEAVLNYTPQPSLTERVKTLLANGKTQEARQQVFDHRADPRNRFDNVENKINRLGYELMNERNLGAALEVFKLNAELYPGSANVYDSLAECYWKRGELPAAIQHCERAIALDPNGPVGANSARMLKEVRAQVQSVRK